MIKGGDLFGDGVNIAARLQTLASAGGVCLSGVAYDQVRKILPFAFADLGAQQVKNIDELVRAFSVVAERSAVVTATANASIPLALPDKPSIAVLPFQNMSGDPEQEYFADGMAEDIITALSRFKALFVIARNSSFTYRGRAVDVRQVGRELGCVTCWKAVFAKRQTECASGPTRRYRHWCTSLGRPTRRYSRRHLRSAGSIDGNHRWGDRSPSGAGGD